MKPLRHQRPSGITALTFFEFLGTISCILSANTLGYIFLDRSVKPIFRRGAVRESREAERPGPAIPHLRPITR